MKKIGYGIILSIVVLSGICVGAVNLYNAKQISYEPQDTKWNVNDIGAAIEDLYKQYGGNSCENVAKPNLGDKLVPITLSNDGIVTYADTSKDWYSYCNKEWANAVILIDTPSKEYKTGDIIIEDDIESYFVWIPKYKYKLWNTGVASKKAHSIEIIFSTENTIDEEGISCATPMTSGNLGNCNNGEWMTHPAFLSMDVDGFWAGKFEIGYKGATSSAEANLNSEEVDKIIVKPNVFAWRTNSVYNFFVTSYNYERELDSHMMKNTEWGAVAILSHSEYGINREININNNNLYKTGYSALPTTNRHTYPGDRGDGELYNEPYNTEVGYRASTTGNITGVYDMSGGSFEYVASYVETAYGESGFDATNIANYDKKYFDIYNANSTIDTYEYMILGDATSEVGPFKSYLDGTFEGSHNNWYADVSLFGEPDYSWTQRGGGDADGILASQFSFARYTGVGDGRSGARLVLAP